MEPLTSRKVSSSEALRSRQPATAAPGRGPSAKRDAHDRQNAAAARIILADPKYDGSLMHRWALMVLG